MIGMHAAVWACAFHCISGDSGLHSSYAVVVGIHFGRRRRNCVPWPNWLAIEKEMGYRGQKADVQEGKTVDFDCGLYDADYSMDLDET